MATGVLSAARPRNLANATVALVVVLGSRTVEMPVTQSSIIHGPRAFRLAEVSCGVTEFCNTNVLGTV